MNLPRQERWNGMAIENRALQAAYVDRIRMVCERQAIQEVANDGD